MKELPGTEMFPKERHDRDTEGHSKVSCISLSHLTVVVSKPKIIIHAPRSHGFSRSWFDFVTPHPMSRQPLHTCEFIHVSDSDSLNFTFEQL